MIIETEAYTALDDPACHTFTRPSARKFLEKHPAGTAYVYLNYGVHWLFNILVKRKNEESHGFVVVRAMGPSSAIEIFGLSQLSSCAPSTSCPSSASAIVKTGSNDGWKLQDRERNFDTSKILSTPQIAISQAKEGLWRFLID